MSAKIPSDLTKDCKDFLQAAAPALQLHRSLAAVLTDTIPPLRRYKADWPIAYDSAIAFQLAAQQQRSPLTVAQQTAAALSTDLRRWQIQVVPPGLIRFHSSEVEIAACLQQFLSISDHCFSPKLHRPEPVIAPSQFRVQYVHARCCMLLRSATREGWFARSQSPEVPWLTDAGELRLRQSIERQTIGLLFDGADLLAADRRRGEARMSDRMWQRAVELSQSLDAFQAACRVWGIKANDLPLAQARLGLTWAGQQLLKVLLNWIGIEAPTLL